MSESVLGELRMVITGVGAGSRILRNMQAKDEIRTPNCLLGLNEVRRTSKPWSDFEFPLFPRSILDEDRGDKTIMHVLGAPSPGDPDVWIHESRFFATVQNSTFPSPLDIGGAFRYTWMKPHQMRWQLALESIRVKRDDVYQAYFALFSALCPLWPILSLDKPERFFIDMTFNDAKAPSDIFHSNYLKILKMALGMQEMLTDGQIEKSMKALGVKFSADFLLVEDGVLL